LIFTVAAAAGLVFGSGCSSECQQLCTAWYDYQRDTCGAVNTDDERVTCISDYRRSRTSEEELSDCSTRVTEVRTMQSAGDGSCCSWNLATCPAGQDDDDSATVE
jgi:hypothetical protein